MSKLKTPTKRKRLTAIFGTGAILLITGISLWLYTNSVIQTHEQLLSNTNLTLEEKWRYEGSLQWWKTARITTYDPIAVTLITIGLVAILYTILYAIVQPQ